MERFSYILKVLKEGRIPPLQKLEEVIEHFLELTLKEQTALVVYGRGIPHIRELLKSLLPLREEIKTALLEGNLIEVPVPTVDRISNEGKLSRVYLIDSSPELWTNAQEYLSILNSKLKPLVGKDFIVLFEEKYEGYSFLLPLAVGLLEPLLLKKYCFSGNLTAEGNLLPVEGLGEKEKACRREGKILFSSNDFWNLAELLDYTKASFKNIPFLVSTIGKGERLLKDYQSLLESVGIVPKEVLFKRIFGKTPYGELGFLSQPSEWKRAIAYFEKFIEKVDSTFEDAWLHMSLIAPAPLAFAYGIMHGAHKRVIFYHYQGGKYFPTVIINEETSREIKNFIGNPRWVEAEFIPSKGKKSARILSVVLDMVSHPIKGSVLNYLKKEGINSDVLVIHHKEKGILKPNRLWTEDIAETFTFIRNYFALKPYEEINFFFGTPVAFAFGLGVAFGHYAKGGIYSFYRDRNPQYVKVLRLEDIKKVR